MKIQWKKLIFKIALWLVAEITLNLLGLDNIADYGEFLEGQNFSPGSAIN